MKRLINHVSLTRRLRQLLVLLALLLLPAGMWAEDYPITIAGVQVTSDNASNITGTNITEGTVSFEYDATNGTSTLNLNGVTINGDIVYTSESESSLWINLYGASTVNRITHTSQAETNLYVNRAETNTVTHSLTVEGNGTDAAISGFSNMASIMTERYDSNEKLYWKPTVTNDVITSLLVTTDVSAEAYNLWISGTQVTTANAANVLGDDETPTVVYDAENHKLTLNGASVGQITYSGTSNLTIAFSGTCSITTEESNDAIRYVGSESTRPKLTFSSTNGTLTINGESIEGFSDVDFGSLNLASISAQGVYYDKEGFLMRGRDTTPSDLTITTETYYPIWIYDSSLSYTGYSHTQLRRDSTVTVGGGTVSFDGDHTITISNINFNYEGNALVVVGPSMPALTVDLVGQSTATSGCTVLSLWDTTPLTFTTDASTPGSITGYDIVSWNYSGNGQISYENGLRAFYDADEPYQETISTTGTYIKIGNTEVSATGNINTAEGTAYFDATSNTLTLTDATIGEQGAETGTDIQVLVDDLTIEISGTNTIYGNITYNGSNYQSSNIQINKASSAESASLTATNVSGFSSCTWGDGLYLSAQDAQGATIDVHYEHYEGEGGSMQSYYGVIAEVTFSTTQPSNTIWVNGISPNADGNFIDPTTNQPTEGLSFNASKSTLTLTNASISTNDNYPSPLIVCNGDLTVNLVGEDNQVYFNGSYGTYVFKNNGATGILTFTGEGTLHINSEYDEGTYFGLCDGFSTVNFGDLAYTINGDSKKISPLDISTPMMNVYEGKIDFTTEGYLFGSTTYYKIVYADGSGNEEEVPLTNVVSNQTFDFNNYNEKITISELTGPCTVYAYTKYKTETGNSAKAKYFGFTEPLTITYNGTAFELTTADLPAIFPAIEEGDDVTYQIGGVSQGTAVNYDEQTQKYMVQGIGTAVLEINLMQGDNTPYQVLNEVAQVTVNVVRAYDLYIGETQVTELNADDVLGDDGTVSFTPEDATNETPATLTLNGAELTAPLIVGLENLTIDIKGENTITTDVTCIQKMSNTNPSLTFKSNGDVVGSLTLTNTNTESLDGVLSSTFENITISRELAPIMLRYGNYTSYTGYLTAGEVHNTQFVPSLGVQVGEIQVYAGNAANVLYDAETPTAVYDVENHKLTLNGARISGAVSTSLENLTIELVGNNSIYQGGSYATLQSMYGDAVTMTIQSTGATPGTLTMNQPYTQAGTFADALVTLDITSPLTVLSGSLTGNDGNENTVVIGAYTVAFAGSNSWATYYGTKDFTVPEGLTAYPVSSVNETTGVVTVPEQGLSYIPANTGVLLKRTDTTVSDYAFTAYTGQTTNITSILQGTSEATSVGGILEGYTDGSTVYVLYNDAFVKATTGTIPANRGFLVFGDELYAPRLTIEIEGEATGINTVQGAGVMDNDYYDLSGRKLSGKPTKSGLYIKNGTKVLVK